jgi:hypothetical protein
MSMPAHQQSERTFPKWVLPRGFDSLKFRLPILNLFIVAVIACAA